MSNKVRFALWAEQDVLDIVKANYASDECKTQSEFIEKAVLFYSGYLRCKADPFYLPRILSDELEGIVGVMANRIGRLLFKMAVEISMMMHIIAADTEIDQETLERLRVRCVNDVKRTNGQIRFKDILQFQKET